jgi:hypothetical protein
MFFMVKMFEGNGVKRKTRPRGLMSVQLDAKIAMMQIDKPATPIAKAIL